MIKPIESEWRTNASRGTRIDDGCADVAIPIRPPSYAQPAF